MEIRRFTDTGLDQFRRYLSDLRDGSNAGPPTHLLTDRQSSVLFHDGPGLEPCSFSTRLEAARYLHRVLSELDREGLESDVHFWSWLSLYYFDQVCPPQGDGRRHPGRDYRHIPEPGYPHGHRHLLGGAYLVYTVYGWGEELSRLLLHSSPSMESRFHHELTSRQSLITNRGIMEAADRLYYDEARARPKPGSLKRPVPGGLYRFIDVIQQLDVTFDLYSLKAGELLRLLPSEFRPWLKH